MKPKILIITLLLLGFVHLAQGSIPPLNGEVPLRLYENDPFWEESRNDNISLPSLAYQGVLLIEDGVCYQIVHNEYLS